MNEANLIETWDVLIDFGFQPDGDVLSGGWPGLSYDFGNFKLNASCVVNMRFAEIVLFTGVLSARRVLADVEFEMPRRVESREQCAAWIVWHLDRDRASEVHLCAQTTSRLGERRKAEPTRFTWAARMGIIPVAPSQSGLRRLKLRCHPSITISIGLHIDSSSFSFLRTPVTDDFVVALVIV